MSEPIYTELMEDLWARLPEVIRTEDEKTDWALKRWFSSVVDIAGGVDELFERIDFDSLEDGGAPGDTSALVDPATADKEWLPWLAQFLGLRISHIRQTQDQRAYLAQSGEFRKQGNVQSMIDAARTALVGEKYVRILKFTSSGANPGQAGMWDMLVRTKSSETLENLYTAQITEVTTPNRWSTSSTIRPILLTNQYDKGLHLDRALMFEQGNTGPLAVTINEDVQVVATDPYTALLTLASDQASLVVTASLEWHGDSGFISSTQEAITLTTPMDYYQIDVSGTAPAGATFARLKFDTSTLQSGKSVYAAQPSIATGSDTQWIAVTADPIRAIIDAGVKPAGVVLHHEVFSATWADIEAAYPTWADIEAAGTWEAIEETGP